MKTLTISVMFVYSLLLAGCVTDQYPIVPAKPQSAALNVSPIRYIVQDDGNIVKSNGLIENLNFPQFSEFVQKGRYIHLRNRLMGSSSFEVERRTDNEIAGSGKVYLINFNMEKGNEGYTLTLQPASYRTYQDGLILPFPVPPFSEEDLKNHLINAQIYYKYEIDSPYNTESTYANFKRLLKTRTFEQGEKDPVTGKIFKQQFILSYKNKEVIFVLEIFPYQNGSKAVMYIRVPAIETSPNTVNFGIIIQEIKTELAKIVNS